MTTAGRPTWDSAKGGRGKWEGDLSAMSKQYSVRDLPAHTKLKMRQEGQGRPEDLQDKDFKRTVEEKERRAALEKTGKAHGSAAAMASLTASSAGDKRSQHDGSASEVPTVKRLRSDVVPTVTTANLDADDPWDEDYDEDDEDNVALTTPSRRSRGKKATGQATKEGDPPDGEDANDGDDLDEESDEDEELLLAELAKIKRERAEEAARLATERKSAQETIRMENILKGNPLLNSGSTSEFKVKRRWDDDVVFKNCARGEVDHAKRGFVNDTLRTEFHKKFMRKYIQ